MNPTNKTDHIFLKHFAQIIAVLFGVMVLLIIGAHAIYSDHLPEPSPRQVADVEARIAPAGGVYAGETGRAAQAAAAEAALKAAASQVAYEGTLDGSVIYGKLCQACHTTGAGGAPQLTTANWSARIAQGMDTLVKHAVDGYQGPAGLMPARGGNPGLTDEQVKATVQWMVDNVK